MILRAVTALAIASCWVHSLAAEEAASVPALTSDQQTAVESVMEARVLTTISFLASDEMAGRNTPSKELNIAAAYVAARFRGAGLEGLGPEGSFFQTSELTMSQPPANGFRLTDSNGLPIPVVGMLAGGASESAGSAKVVAESDPAEGTGEDLSGHVILIDDVPLPPQALDRPQQALAIWKRRLRRFEDSHAAAFLIRTQEGTLLSELTQSLTSTPLPDNPAARIDTPVFVLAPGAAIESGQTVQYSTPGQDLLPTPVHNVIGVIRGSDPELAQEAVFITAHLDHIGTLNRGEDLINNGADDNATGVTAVLTLADAFASLESRPRRSVVFMTFWGEEKGLLGSKRFVQNPLWPLDRIVTNVNIEMVGRPETDAREKAWMTGWKHSNLGSLLNLGSTRIGVEIFDRTDIGEMLYTRSDNHAFVQAGIIAHSVSAGSLHDDYHQPSDEWTKLDLAHMTRVIQGLFAGILPIANADVTPQKTEP
jgi:hypothetical protein